MRRSIVELLPGSIHPLIDPFKFSNKKKRGGSKKSKSRSKAKSKSRSKARSKSRSKARSKRHRGRR